MNPARRIREDIEARIHSGEWWPGTRIPFEHELVERYGCARATVSKALGALAEAGLIERRRKAGSFVAHPPVHSAVMEIPDLAELIARRGETYRWEALAIAPAARDEGDIHPGLHITGIHHAGASPSRSNGGRSHSPKCPRRWRRISGKRHPGRGCSRIFPGRRHAT